MEFNSRTPTWADKSLSDALQGRKTKSCWLLGGEELPCCKRLWAGAQTLPGKTQQGVHRKPKAFLWFGFWLVGFGVLWDEVWKVHNHYKGLPHYFYVKNNPFNIHACMLRSPLHISLAQEDSVFAGRKKKHIERRIFERASKNGWISHGSILSF